MAHTIKQITLINSGLQPKSRSPAGVAFLAGVCEANNLDYEIIDLNIEFSHQYGPKAWGEWYAYSIINEEQVPAHLNKLFDEFLDEITDAIVNNDTDCVAMSITTYYQHEWAYRFLKKLRAKKNILTIIGGPAINQPYQYNNLQETFGKFLVNRDLIDYYALGEGDQLFDNFLKGSRCELGLNDKFSPETWVPQVDNLDAVPVPSYKKIDLSRYESPNNTHIITITGSRGCVRRCSFCDIGATWKKFRFRSGENIANEILKHHLDTGVTNFWFSDSLINGSLKVFQDMLERLVALKQQYPILSTLTFSGLFIVRPKGSHTERLFKLMNAVGCDNIAIGIESGSAAVREHMGKKFSNEDIDYHFEMCEKYKIKNWIMMMVSYPTETEQDFQDTVDMLVRLQKYIINHTLLGFNLKGTVTILPQTPLKEAETELKIVYNNKDHYTGLRRRKIELYDNWNCETNPELTKKRRWQRWIELIRLAVKLGYNLHYELPYDIISNRNNAAKLLGIEFDDNDIPEGYSESIRTDHYFLVE